MKKIRRLGQLRKERRRLAEQRIRLERSMELDWTDLKKSIAPVTLVRHLIISGGDWIKQKWFNHKK